MTETPAKVVITVLGGVVEVQMADSPIIVEVIDYDTEVKSTYELDETSWDEETYSTLIENIES